ncbi:glycosyltransferase family 2 protein [Candidatus Kaiserbacteria bacterium]|nr:glycosyltransferase family 2 protein [Candidatus Kaiserbacteria bacterium]
MDITLIIPAHNEEKHIGGCIESAQKHAAGKFKEILVIDNASDDRTAEIAASYAGVRVVRESHKGLTHARQAGYEAATTEYIAYIDADCRMPDLWFSVAEKHFEKYPDTVALTGPVQYFDGPMYLRALVEFVEWIALPVAYWVAGYLIIGGNFIIRRDAVAAVGGFDKSISFYGEDADIARRVAKVGPVYLRMHMVIYTSMRRFMHDGIIRTSSNYTVNFVWHKFFSKSYTHVYTDVR